jgi:NAD(P)-dependent dehydrogenase (short-subunit alcohol dehydrogenase family)
MVNRKEDQGEEAVKKIKEEAGENAQVEWVGCDMGDLKQIKEVFTGIREREERLDLVCLLTYHVYPPTFLHLYVDDPKG